VPVIVDDAWGKPVDPQKKCATPSRPIPTQSFSPFGTPKTSTGRAVGW